LILQFSQALGKIVRMNYACLSPLSIINKTCDDCQGFQSDSGCSLDLNRYYEFTPES